MERINVTGISERDGDRLRELLQLFAERAGQAKEDYEQARDEHADSSQLAILRTRWKAWHAAHYELGHGFTWSTVPSTVSLQARQQLVEEQRHTAAELSVIDGQNPGSHARRSRRG